MRKTWRTIIPLAALLGLASCGEEEPRPRNCLPFSGARIIAEPEVFKLNDINTYNGIAFTPNGCELYITQDIDGVAQILHTEWSGRFWVQPERVGPISSPHHDYQPRFNADGTRLYFNSSRPIPGSEGSNGQADDGLRKLWYMEKDLTGWSGPHYLEGINSDDPDIRDGYAAPIGDGSLYFRSTRASGDPDNGDIFFARWNGTGFNKPVLVQGISSPRDENDLVVTKDDKIMVLNRYVDNPEDTYLMISVKENDQWSIPRAVEQPANEFQMELTPSLSPDEIYFLYEIRGVTFVIDLHALLTDAELAKIGKIRRGTEED